jgi:hypothetical protein
VGAHVIENRVSQISSGHAGSLPLGHPFRNGKGGEIPARKLSVAESGICSYVFTM